MKQIWLRIVQGTFKLFLLLPAVAAAEPAAVFRFGTAELNSQLTNRFEVPNPGVQALQIQAVTPSCECIRILAWPTNVAAGTTGEVEVLFVPDKAGEVDYRVYIKPLGLEEPEIEFAIQGVVTAAPVFRIDRDWSLYLGPEEAEKLVRQPEQAVWVDVRSPEAYARAQIPGSLQMPLYAVKTKGFLRGRPVVLVDEGFGSQALEAEARSLRKQGFTGLSIWHGGLNAWQRRGGSLQGDSPFELASIPPAALADIAPASDWLVVAADRTAPDGRPDTLAIPFAAGSPDEFVTALNTALKEQPQVRSVLIVTSAGGDYGPIGKLADRINAFVFFLEGGWAAREAHEQFQAAIQQGHTVKTTTTQAGGTSARSGGCGGCPK